MPPSDRQLANLTFSLVGPGRVGSSLAAWATAAGGRLIEVAGRDGELSSAGQDLLLVAVPDGALDAVAASLAARPQAAVVLHTSGSRTAEALAPLSQSGSAVGSLHPLKAFPTARPDPSEAHGIFFGLDGDPAAVALGARLAAAWGAQSGEIPPDSRLLYHFAASLAAGGVTTLLAAAADLAGRLELPPGVVGGYLELARGAIDAARETTDPARAITGPAARGDRDTLLAQLANLAEIAPEMAPWVRALAAETLRQRERVGLGGSSHRTLLAELEEQ
ncbi:MAG TPA: DUF2520 domain-containing protein [Thermoanaerobaculia bacterium]|nr:DUF2520 domain-containing protein [Thermoanaerobaculia bacterium]